jgi:hypothetical protein
MVPSSSVPILRAYIVSQIFISKQGSGLAYPIPFKITPLSHLIDLNYPERGSYFVVRACGWEPCTSLHGQQCLIWRQHERSENRVMVARSNILCGFACSCSRLPWPRTAPAFNFNVMELWYYLTTNIVNMHYGFLFIYEFFKFTNVYYFKLS